MRIAIQGVRASFHDEAARRWFGDDIAIVPCDTFGEVFEAVNRHDADAAVIAIENSLYGGINQVYDLLESYRYPIVGEIHLPIHQQLIGTPGETITHVYSHAVALAQCEAYLEANYPEAERSEYHDTAAAVEFVKKLGDPHAAAIASSTAAALYGMSVIRENIEDNPANFTRFLVIKPDGTPPRDTNRATLVITTKNTPGSLAKVLTAFADKNINLSKLLSRPIVGEPWKYRFYIVVDCAGDELEQALASARTFCTEQVVLGQYCHDASL